MKFSIHQVSVSPPGERSRRGFGWSKVFVHLRDEDADVLPSVTVAVHVPYKEDQSFREAREIALTRSKEIIQAALKVLDQTSLVELDAAAQGQSEHKEEGI